MNFILKANNFIKKNELRIIWCVIIIFVIIIFSLLLTKYQSFGYNALDLGIYNQVFYNSAQGNLFDMSIHPHSYLGDHFEIFILLLLPLYLLFQSPLTLLFLQIVFIVLSVWPIYLIAKDKLKSPWRLILILIFLFNPFILNILFFEFHILPFAIPLLLFTFYFYQKKQFIPFIIFLLLSLLVREDVSLVIIMFGILAIVEKRKIKWILWPILAGALWFLGSMQLTAHFNQYGDYKFLSMYGWLGNNFSEIISNILLKPWIILKQIFSLNNILSFFAIFISFLGLPLLKPKYFILILLVAVQLLLLSPNTSILIETHYTSLLIPFVFISLIFVLSKIVNNNLSNSIYIFINKKKSIILILFFTTFLYSFVTLSPIPRAFSQSNEFPHKNNYISEKIGEINENDNIITSFNFLPNLTNRKNIYSLHYAYLGKQQFSDRDFIIDKPIDSIVVDFDDFIIYYVQTKYNDRKKELYPNGATNINKLIESNDLKLTSIFDTYGIYNNSEDENYSLVDFNVSPTTNNEKQIDYQLKLIATEKNSQQIENTLGWSFYWQTNNKLDDDYFINVSFIDSNNKIVKQKIYPLGYGLYPTSTWPVNETIKTNYWFARPIEYNTISKLNIQVIKIIDGRLQLNSVRTAEIKISDYENIGDSFEIDYNIL